MLTQIEADKINKSSVAAQAVDLGNKIRAGAGYISFAITVDGTSGLTIPVPYAIKILAVKVQCTVASGGGTVTLRKGTTAITDAIICAVDKVTNWDGTLDDEQTEIAAGSTNLNVITNGAADRGIVTILVSPV